MSGGGEKLVSRVWYGDSRWYLPLLPLSWLYAGITGLRRYLYRRGFFTRYKVGVPVIVIGNITAGGTGKTPVAVWLAQRLRERGYTAGIVSRGYRGNVGPAPREATAQSDPGIVGDEPVLMARRSGCPVAVHPDRVAASGLLLEKDVDVIIADDGLQHYRLARDVEIAVVDGRRLWGNGRLLPAGPLREPVSRLRQVDCVLVQSDSDVAGLPPGAGDVPTAAFRLRATVARRLDESAERPLSDFAGSRVHAVAGIGNPDRFFDMLANFGIDVIRHPLPDHASPGTRDLVFADDYDVVMTEKDAVKCRAYAGDKLWYVPVELEMARPGEMEWLDAIEQIIRRREGADHG